MIERVRGAGFALGTVAPVGVAGDPRRESRERHGASPRPEREDDVVRADAERIRNVFRRSARLSGVVDGKPRSQMFAKAGDQRVENIVDAFGE